MSWGWTVLEENAFVVLYDSSNYWVIEDKTMSKAPVKFTGETKTLKNIAIDFAQGPDGGPVFVRAYYPKGQIEFRLVKRAFERLSQDRTKEFQRLKRLLEAKEAYEHV